MLTFQWLLVLLVESRMRALSNWGWLTCFACGLAGALAATPDIPADADPSQRRLPLVRLAHGSGHAPFGAS